jgi:hypothetical protein
VPKRSAILFALSVLASTSFAPRRTALTAADDAPTPKEVFEKRLLPIFKSPNPSSCTQCHLSAVDLKYYLLPSHEDTFVSLRDQGLIDLDKPDKSKILALIKMGEAEKGKSALIHQKTRKAEYEAFADWIKRSAADPRLRELPKLAADKLAKPKRPNEVIQHARKDRVLESFTNNVWPIRFRCMNCHTEGSPQAAKHVKEHGERVAWFKAAGPEATLDYLRNSKLMDANNPEKSLLLRKPLNEVKHGGGIKFVKGDQGYKAMRAFLEDYARIVKDDYAKASDLPKVKAGLVGFGTDVWFKLANTPADWGDKLLQVSVYAQDAKTKTWEAQPIATSDRVVWGKGKTWQHNLTLLAAKGSERAAAWSKGGPSLPPGRYLVKVYVDRDARLAKDWKAALATDDFVGEAEVRSDWPAGYGRMTVVEAAKVKK